MGKCISNQALLAKIEETLASQFPIEKIIYTDKKQLSSEIILKYVDFSSKYGMGYKLNNGSYGVLFNDSTKIVLDANCFHFDYVHRQPQQGGEDFIEHFDFFTYPQEINKKVVLL